MTPKYMVQQARAANVPTVLWKNPVSLASVTIQTLRISLLHQSTV